MRAFVAKLTHTLKRAAGLGLAAILLPLTAQAQDWRFAVRDDGVVFNARISTPGRPGFSLMCSTRKPNAPRVLPPYYEGTIFTRPDEFHFAFSRQDFRAPSTGGTLRDVVLVIGASGYQLPGITWDDYRSEWSTRIQATGAMFDAISTVPSFEIRSSVGSQLVGTSGFAQSYATLVNACRRQFAASFQPWRSGFAAAPPVAPVSMRKAAEASVSKGCNGASTYEPHAFLNGDIDGDGVEDVVLDWGGITCTTGTPRPFCGASQCSAEVFLSQLFPRRQRPEDMLGLGVRLQPLNNGAMAVAVGGSLATCHAAGLQSCEFLFYWNGSDFVNLP